MTKRVPASRTITVDDYYSERFLRIEVELKHQRELMKLGFEETNRRFEAMDKRFETLTQEMNRRFETVDKRFETMSHETNRRFDALTQRIDRFMVWSFATSLTFTGLVIAAMKLWK